MVGVVRKAHTPCWHKQQKENPCSGYSQFTDRRLRFGLITAQPVPLKPPKPRLAVCAGASGLPEGLGSVLPRSSPRDHSVTVRAFLWTDHPPSASHGGHRLAYGQGTSLSCGRKRQVAVPLGLPARSAPVPGRGFSCKPKGSHLQGAGRSGPTGAGVPRTQCFCFFPFLIFAG